MLEQDRTSPEEVTTLLRKWQNGDSAAMHSLIPLLYRDLHRMAKLYLSKSGENQTLQATALIHEAWIKLHGGIDGEWQGRNHFFAVSAKVMRHILVDQARSRHAARRGAGVRPLELDEAVAVVGQTGRDLIALDDALTVLAQSYPRHAQVIELRYFGGLTVEETAEVLQLSPETVARDWRFAKSFLRKQIVGEESR